MDDQREEMEAVVVIDLVSEEEGVINLVSDDPEGDEGDGIKSDDLEVKEEKLQVKVEGSELEKEEGSGSGEEGSGSGEEESEQEVAKPEGSELEEKQEGDLDGQALNRTRTVKIPTNLYTRNAEKFKYISLNPPSPSRKKNYFCTSFLAMFYTKSYIKCFEIMCFSKSFLNIIGGKSYI